MNVEQLVRSTRRTLSTVTDRLAFLGPALIRLTVGVVFVRTGWGKLQDLDQVTAFFTELGIPAPALNAAVAAGTEFFGGLLILVGLGSRLVALPLAFTMFVAIMTAKRAELNGLGDLLGFEEWSYLVMFLAIAFGGPGALSLDALLARFFARGAGQASLPTPLPAPGVAAH